MKFDLGGLQYLMWKRYRVGGWNIKRKVQGSQGVKFKLENRKRIKTLEEKYRVSGFNLSFKREVAV